MGYVWFKCSVEEDWRLDFWFFIMGMWIKEILYEGCIGKGRSCVLVLR